MEIKYYGTAAGGGIPEIFCSCRVCEAARKNRGHDIRTRSQAVIDGKLSIDFSVDSFMHTLHGGLDMRNIHNILITHSHHDHFMPSDMISRPQGVKEPLNVYGNEASVSVLKKQMDAREEAFRSGKRIKTSDFEIDVHYLSMYEPVQILDYTVIPLRARHAENLGSMIYIIRSADRAVLWCHDTGLLHSEVWDYLEKCGILFDFVSLDCTLKRSEQITKAHMDIDWCKQTADRLKEIGCADSHTVFALSHIGHLVEKTHDELSADAAKEGMIVAYDGLSIIV